MTKPIPEEPKFVKTATSIQKWLAGIAVSMFIVVVVTGFEFIQNIFKPNFINALLYLRMGIALVGIGITSVVGFEQIKKMMDWLVDSWEFYKKISELKKEKEKEK